MDFKPKHFLRCHSKQKKDPADVQTQVWQCSFEPAGPGRCVNMVATCGGNTVCFVDLSTGQVKKKYYSSNNRENFLALAWTKINGHTILAAGGSVQTIYLISYDDAFCFHEEKFDKALMNAKCAITSLVFHPTQGEILFCKEFLLVVCWLYEQKGYKRIFQDDLICSCSDGKIFIFRIADIKTPAYNAELEVLYKYQVKCEVFLLIHYLPLDILLGTSDDGIYCWNGNPKQLASGKAKNVSTLLQFLGRPLALTESPSLVDTAEILENGLIASKCALHGAIYIWNIDDALGEKKTLEENETIRISPLYQLKWSDTDNYFMYLGYDQESKWLSCGDDRGAIWMYDLREIVSGLRSRNKKTTLTNPAIILEWPNLLDQYSSRKRKLNLDVYDIVINKTIISHGGQYLVAVTNNNMVCIWKRTSKGKLL